MAKTGTHPVTVEEFEQLPDDGCKQELVNGIVVSIPPPKRRHGRLQARLTIHLGSYVAEHHAGEVDNESGFIVRRAPDTVRGPDILFFQRERPEGSDPTKYEALAPDLVAEVASEHDTAADLHAKVLDYLQAGVRLVWVVYPTTQTVMEYQPHADARLYQPGDTLSGAPVLPDFTLPLSELFGD